MVPSRTGGSPRVGEVSESPSQVAGQRDHEVSALSDSNFDVSALQVRILCTLWSQGQKGVHDWWWTDTWQTGIVGCQDPSSR